MGDNPAVVCEPCRDCKYTDCVAVCPVDCFYQDNTMLYVEPDICTDCEACVPECPVEAIYMKSDVPSNWSSYIDLNETRSKAQAAAGENVNQKQEPKRGPGCTNPNA
jgi:ferredoxin